MTTITINERTKAGKAILELAKILTDAGSKGITVAAGLKKPSVKEKSPYNPKFVAMIKKAQKRGNYTTLDTKDIWGSLGLK